jgi:hypothetical protein
MDGWTMDRQTDEQTYRCIDGWADRQMDGGTTDRQMDRWTDGQLDRWTDEE